MFLNASYTTFNGVAIVLVLLPSPWHWRARNTATLLFIFWCLVLVVPNFIGSIIWFNHSHNIAPVWCDMVSKLKVGGVVGVAAASLCITRHLEAIAAARQVHYTKEDRRRRIILDLCLALGLPILVMSWHVVVQGHRFDIVQRVGCQPSIYWSYPAVFLIFIWPPILLLASSIYAGKWGLAIRLFLTRRYQFMKILESSKSAITPSRFLRLMALAVVQIAFSLPIAVYTLATNFVHQPIQPYHSWADVHYGFSFVGELTLEQSMMLGRETRQLLELSQWSYAVSCLLFFLFFGMGEESLEAYARWWRACTGSRGLGESGDELQLEGTTYSTSKPETVTRISLPQYPGTTAQDHDYMEESKAHGDVLANVRKGDTYGGIVVTVRKDNFSSV